MLRNLSLIAALAAPALLLPASLGAQLTDLGNQLLDECDNVPESCETDDQLGSSVAAGDFNGDGFADLAVGVPGETVSGFASAGAIHVFYGSPAGLLLTGDQVFTQNSAGIVDSAEAGDRFGDTLLAGRFNDDAFDDLAVGAPREDLVHGGSNLSNAGAVWVLFGSASGLTGSGSRYFDQDHLPGSSESVEVSDFFGYSLGLLPPNGGLTHNGLFVGAPFEDGIFSNEGVVTLITDSGGILNTAFDIRQSDFFGACGEVGEINDAFGFAIAGGRFGSPFGGGNVAFGSPDEEVSLFPAAGKVFLADTDDPVACWDQNSPGVLDTVETFDEFGSALAAGDFDADGFDDLAIGVPGENGGGAGGDGQGIVQILYGSSSGVDGARDQRFAQSNFSAESSPEASDEFGAVLATGDFDGDDADDLAIGVPGEGIVVSGTNRTAAGLVQVLYGSFGAGLGVTGNQTFHQDLPAGMLGTVGSNDEFGAALAAGDFDGNGVDDLAIGVPGDNPGVTDAGRVNVIYGMDSSIGAFGSAQFVSNLSFSESNLPQFVSITRAGGAVLPATVDFRRTGGTATPGVDFTFVEGTSGWNAGDLADKQFVVLLHEDTLDEPNETIVISLQNPSTGLAVGSPGTITVTIVDDDVAGALSFLQPVFVAAYENSGQATIAVNRTGGAASGVTVHYATSDATAIAGQDYVATSGTLTFGVNETVKTFVVPLLDDGVAEPPEVVNLALSSPGGGGTLGLFPTAQLILVDDEIFLDGFETGSSGSWSITQGGG